MTIIVGLYNEYIRSIDKSLYKYGWTCINYIKPELMYQLTCMYVQCDKDINNYKQTSLQRVQKYNGIYISFFPCVRMYRWW